MSKMLQFKTIELSVNLNLIIIIAKKKCYEFYIRPDENCRSNVKAFFGNGPTNFKHKSDHEFYENFAWC